MGYIEVLIGKLDDDIEEEVLDAIGDRDAAWRRAGTAIASINLLNIASVGTFLSHVAGLAGVDVGEGHLVVRFSSLPWRIPAVWLPIDVEPTLPDSELAFIGSAATLKAELEIVRELSPLALGAKPEGYDAMRADPVAFARRESGPVSAVEQWVWLGLHDAARLALERGAPLRCS